MSTLIIAVVAGLFASLLFLNIYFRIIVFKHYKYLVQNRVEFSLKHVLDNHKMKEEIFTRYPQHTEHIEAFANNLRYSVMIAAGILVVISVLYLIIKR